MQLIVGLSLLAIGFTGWGDPPSDSFGRAIQRGARSATSEL